MKGNIADITVADINRFLEGLEGLGPVSKNGIRRNIVTMFGFAKKQGYLHPDRKTAAEQSDSFKEPENEIEIFTPDEMQTILLAAHARILPLIAIGGFCRNPVGRGRTPQLGGHQVGPRAHRDRRPQGEDGGAATGPPPRQPQGVARAMA